jgi:SAM-dependent methyltransferase
MPTRDRPSVAVEELVLLWAARRSGVLDALLDSAGTPEAVAEAAGVTDHAAAVVVESLADLGFLREVSGEYEITNRALGFLAKRDVRSIGRLPHWLDLLDLWTDLPERMADGRAPATPAEWTRNRLGAHATTDEAAVRARVTAAVRRAPSAVRVVDLFGASGVHAREFAARGFETTLLDEAAVVDAVAPMLRHRDVRTVAVEPPDGVDAGASDTAPLPGVESAAFDLAFAADAVTGRNPGEARALVATAFDALTPGGTAVFVDLLRDGSTEAVRARVRALAAGDGDVYPAADYRRWLTDAGFEDVRVEAVPCDGRSAVAATRPSRGSE